MATKQTAVEWLEEKINLYDFQVGMASMRKYIEYAKAMEKEQIKDAWKDSNYHRASEDVLEYSSNEYYEETYGAR